MPDLPANVIEFDVNRFVAAVLNRAQGGPESGAFIFDGDQISIVSRAAKAVGRYDAAFEFPDDNNDDAPAVAAVFMHHKRLNMGNIVVYLLGHPVGFGEFSWTAYCPSTRKTYSSLYFDDVTGLLVSRGEVGKAAPKSCERMLDNLIVIMSLSERIDAHIPQKSSRKTSGADNVLFELNDVIKLSEFTVDWLQQDLIFAQSGLPMPIWKDQNKIDILASIYNKKPFERLPQSYVNAHERSLQPTQAAARRQKVNRKS